MLDDLSYLNAVVAPDAAQSASPSEAMPPAQSFTTTTASLQPLLDALRISSTSEEDLSQLDDASVSALLEKLDQADL
ncbi:MAG: hypothetical protein CYPHOPRED_002995, partial [Cyphobasidiales sp. Tagirdzhanova-0007]